MEKTHSDAELKKQNALIQHFTNKHSPNRFLTQVSQLNQFFIGNYLCENSTNLLKQTLNLILVCTFKLQSLITYALQLFPWERDKNAIIVVRECNLKKLCRMLNLS